MVGRLNLHVRDDIENRFRGEVFKRKGMKKGNITHAMEEAMLMWVSASATDTPEKEKS